MECIKVASNDYDHNTQSASSVHERSWIQEKSDLRIQLNDMRVIPTIFVCLMGLIVLLCAFCDAVAEVAPNVHRRFRNRLPSRGYPSDDFVMEDEDSMELNKRQLFDDYGHMRFGKRDRFDDYGHMRFGRNHE